MGPHFGDMLGNQTGRGMLNLRHSQRGVTLIELLVGLVIVGFLFAMGAPAFSGWIQNQQIRAAAESILNGIQVARGEAVKNNGRARFVLCGLPGSSWEVLAASAPAPAPAASLACGAGSNAVAGEVRVQERSAQEGSRLAQVSAVDAENEAVTTVTFNSFGRVVGNADGSDSLAQVDVSTPNGTRPLRITLGTAGNARMCDPSTLLSASDPRHC